uniref:Uncharacterized protein n=1 Tax=Anguilla anguilla TaxID=7936 RepID=A0A0E9QYU3_ANGAN
MELKKVIPSADVIFISLRNVGIQEL